MQAQEIFDTVVNHLRQQGCKSSAGSAPYDLRCLYLSADGKKCAVGCLIHADEYSSEMEVWGTVGAVLTNPSCPASLSERLQPHLKLLQDLQRTHDRNPVAHWEAELEFVAEKHNLTYTPPEKST